MILATVPFPTISSSAASVLATASDGSVNPQLGFSGAALAVTAIVVALPIVLFVAGLVSVLLSPRYTVGGKFLWIVLIFCLPILGAIGWFVAGRTAVIRTSAP